VWFGGRIAAIATEARDMALRTSVKQEAHEDECGRRYGALECKIDANEVERKRDADEWRKGLGQRLDSQDGQMRWIFRGIIGVLLAIIGFLVEHAGIFHP
jgi:hypothetical protein